MYISGCRVFTEVNRPLRGSVLILVLIALSSLVSLTVGLAYRTRIELRLTRAMAERTRVFHLALGGIERAKALLEQGELVPSRVAAVCSFCETAAHEALFERVDSFQIGRMHLGYKVRDEQAYLHMDRSNPAGWEKVSWLNRECVASILDWTDSDNVPNPEGAESEFYARADPPHTVKNRPCATLRELLLMRSVDFSRYAGEYLTWDIAHDEQAGGSRSDEDDVVSLGLVDTFTVFGDGAININTVGKEILASLPGLDERAVEAVLLHRDGPDRSPGTADDRFITSATDLAQVENLSELQKDLLSQYCCMESTFFRVFSLARSDFGLICCLMATIRVADGQSKVLCMERLF